ncbi:MAG: agmatinase [Ardenticatenia bacterium]|nr:agmatinase [Ardenticatenia bacterium]
MNHFLDLPPEFTVPERSWAWVLPVPYESTVSYEGGTRKGPAAIIEASAQVELYDPVFEGEPALEYGVHTLLPVPTNHASPEAMVADIARAVETCARPDRLLVVLGGEHTISVGVARGLGRAYGETFTVVVVDAHSDLRDEYEGSRYSHACVSRRLLDEGVDSIFQIGVRAISREEVEFIRAHPERLRVWFADDVHATPIELLLADLEARLHGRRLFISLDVDGLDPSIIPATGTPEPGGLTWPQTLAIVRTVARVARVAAVDCVELAPRPGLHMAEFAAARLLYHTMNAIWHYRSGPHQ